MPIVFVLPKRFAPTNVLVASDWRSQAIKTLVGAKFSRRGPWGRCSAARCPYYQCTQCRLYPRPLPTPGAPSCCPEGQRPTAPLRALPMPKGQSRRGQTYLPRETRGTHRSEPSRAAAPSPTRPQCIARRPRVRGGPVAPRDSAERTRVSPPT